MTATTLTLTENKYPFGLMETLDTVAIFGTAAFGASPLTYTAGGMAISWTSLQSNRFSSKGDGTNVSTPFFAFFVSMAGSGYVYSYIQSTEKLMITTGAAAQSPGAELTGGGAIPAGVSGDVIGFVAFFKRF